MEITNNTVQKVQRVFDDAWLRIHTGNRPVGVSCDPDYHPDDGEFWTIYMNYLDCILITKDDLLGDFPDMVNFGFAVKERVCLTDPCNEGDFILVDQEVAEKALVLGALA